MFNAVKNLFLNMKFNAPATVAIAIVSGIVLICLFGNNEKTSMRALILLGIVLFIFIGRFMLAGDD